MFAQLQVLPASTLLASLHARRIIIDIGKQLGRKLLSGNLNLINITLPVRDEAPPALLQAALRPAGP